MARAHARDGASEKIMWTILFVWTVVAAGSGGRVYEDWRVLSEFSSSAACEKAITDLGLQPKKARCVAKGTQR